MPYRSAKQAAYLHIHHPEIAAKWDKKYGKSPKKRSKAMEGLQRAGKKHKSN